MENSVMAAVFFFLFTALFHPVVPYPCEIPEKFFEDCPPFNCGKLGTIRFPFTNTTRPAHCGAFVVDDCDEEHQKIQLDKGGRWFQVDSISQANTISITDNTFKKQLNSESCESFHNLSLPSLPYASFQIMSKLTFYKCNSTSNVILNFTQYPGCNGANIDVYYSYNRSLPGLPPSCSALELPVNMNSTYHDVFGLLSAKFSLEVHVNFCNWCQFLGGGKCRGKHEDQKGDRKLGPLLAAVGAVVAGVTVALISLCYFGRHVSNHNKKTNDDKRIESFLRNHGCLMPKRFSYSEIKKMTLSFRDKLGQGGNGVVFKGRLPDGRLVAVKVLKELRTNDEDFINEVTSISRTSHVNIVTLLGFCVEDSRRALIYEFMSNGSLEKYIHQGPSQVYCRLGWETLYQIAIGIAQGLEYLHRGCNTRILHFDIKPHNILLDENFGPKISDFGLAKICLQRESIISMSVARGTAGYIAPELFCRNFGRVSHKSDVYSYGMMVLEMIGGRRNISTEVENTSEIYFPEWIYKNLESGEELGLPQIRNKDENQLARRMIIVSLWCIQTKPSDRPPMSRVIEMLQGSIQPLLIPPRPYLSSAPSSPQRLETNSSTTLGCDSLE